MIKFILLGTICFHIVCKSWSKTSDAIILELGESKLISAVKENVWIENQKVAIANTTHGIIRIKALTIGSTLARFDRRQTEIIVLPVGHKKSFDNWKTKANLFANLEVDQCQNVICLTGQLSTMKEFKRLIKIMNQNQMPAYIGMKLNEKLQTQIENWYAEQLKKEGLSPYKIVFSEPWKVFSNSTEVFYKNSKFFEKNGILMLEDKTKMELTDNLRVEIKIVEVKKEFVRQLGIKWPDVYNAQVLPTLAGVDSIEALILGNERNGDMNILASPNLICKSGKEATFFAGGEFPVKTYNDKSSSVSWKSYGINLKIKPQLDSIGQINLEIESEVSSIDKSHEIDGVPALYSHKVTSHFNLKKSQTIILSGLIKAENGKSVEGLAYLSQLPILGRLFSSQNYLENKSELVIFVTPKVVGQ